MSDLCLEITAADPPYYSTYYTVGELVPLTETTPGLLWEGGHGFQLTYNSGTDEYTLEETVVEAGTTYARSGSPAGAYILSTSGGNFTQNISIGPCSSGPGPVTLRVTQVKLVTQDFATHKTFTDGLAVSELGKVELKMTDGASALDSPPSPSPRPQDTISLTESIWYGELISFLTDLVGASETLSTTKGFVLVEVIQLLESLSVRAQRVILETVQLTETLKGGLSPYEESVALSDLISIGTALEEFIVLADLMKLEHSISDDVLATEVLSQQFANILSDTILHFDRVLLEVAARYPDIVRVNDQILKQLTVTKTDIVLAVEAWWAALLRPWWETVSVHDLLTIENVELIIGCEVTLRVSRVPLTITNPNEVASLVADPPVRLMRC